MQNTKAQRYNQGKAAKALPRVMQVYDVRNRESLTYRQIGELFGISEAQACRDYAKAQSIVLSKYADKGDKAREKHARMLYGMLASLEDKALTGDLPTIAESRKLIAELNAMYGVYPKSDQPAQVIAQQFVLQWNGAAQPTLPQADIVQGRIVTEDEDNG